jgi:hypothetical protein
MRRTINLAVIFIVAVLVSNSCYSMRCGTHLITEGDSATKAVQLCGNPSFDNYSTIIYTNKDGDGANYTLHVNGAGMIDSVTFSIGNE